LSQIWPKNLKNMKRVVENIVPYFLTNILELLFFGFHT
jgi:hypothetical protein